jgi:hypothetical protein
MILRAGQDPIANRIFDVRFHSCVRLSMYRRRTDTSSNAEVTEIGKRCEIRVTAARFSKLPGSKCLAIRMSAMGGIWHNGFGWQP